MKLWLVDTNPELVAAWQVSFDGFENVFIHEGDILAQSESALVSSANSYGFMDGGIDRLYTVFLGLTVQTRLQNAICTKPEGYLPVGSAELVRTNHDRILYLIAAPTMATPVTIPSQNCFYAMLAVLKVASRHPETIQQVFCPGLGTGIGQVPPTLAAQEMAAAYGRWMAQSRARQET